MEIIKKKRGRKPNNNIIINENPVFDNTESTDIIVKLDDINNNNNNNNNSDNDIKNIIENNIESTFSELNINNTKKICWNCCLPINNYFIGLPIKYIDNVFITYGNFCSLECSAKYCFDNFENNSFEIYSILNLYYNKIQNTTNKKVNIAKDKLYLDIFGGNLTEEEYKKNFDIINYDNLHNIKIKQYNNLNNIKSNNKVVNKLKLFRNIKNKNNISNIMNL